LEAARVAFTARDAARGEDELALGLRLDPGIAAHGLALLESGDQALTRPSTLVLYGDLLAAAGRDGEAAIAYDRAAAAESEITMGATATASTARDAADRDER
ncbi:MAG: hypothetical protein M3295_10450, partial [Chloroflexota bacterium]|nr:hypothetical protein [Chloroflexota bacterium]